ncbi:hypothetical protein HMPREF1624_00168 [Sporothrix schenckii ATCC 58251]|uniref:Short-chain dehydrogenase n=1 Tax=Sporothrix schenckii (strain ATCC 58251 / de Perez 2211183) TaxID=1391915 RepID=U7Q1W1_SPOS1|nr:hypothetical protein HMPREF1624_00168 [Sporothrix schenckii ATCC 58251]
MASIGFLRPSMMAQNVMIPAPKFTEKNLKNLAGKVYLITGANAGVGKELTRILYTQNATVFMACRSQAKCEKAMEDVKAAAPSSTGALHFVQIDLGDLRTIKPAVESFLAKAKRLDVLFNNAGVMLPPSETTTTVQGFDLQLGTNTVAPFLLTQLLTPILQATAKDETAAGNPAGVRVVWVASMAAELYSGKNGVDMTNLPMGSKTYARPISDPMELYGNSKAGSYLHSVEYARRHKADGIVSVAANPGNLDSDLYRSIGGRQEDKPQQQEQEVGLSWYQRAAMKYFRTQMLHPPVYGAYTELFAGLSPDVTLDKSGAWIGPWGRFFGMRSDIASYGKPKSECGGKGGAEAFWTWTTGHVKEFA